MIDYIRYTATFTELYWLGVALALVWGVINNFSFRYIARHSDGGGSDSGSSYSFHPYLKLSESEVYRGEMMAWQGTPVGEKVLRILIKFIPFYAALSILLWLMFFLIPLLMWLLFPNDKHRSSQLGSDRLTRKVTGLW
jgi:hypothetical protein